MNTLTCDVAVIGGGPAGVCAALASARQGMETLLVCDRPVLGGNSSSEIRVWSRGAVGGGNMFAEEMGIWGELKLTNLLRNPEANVLHWDEVLFDAVLAEPKLTVMLNTLAQEVELEADQRTIKSVKLYGIRTEQFWLLQAKQYVDCTGNGTIAAQAGVPFRIGREGKDVFGESNALAESDKKTQGASILIQSKRVSHAVPYIAPDYIYSLEEVKGLINRGGRIVYADMQGSDCWWFEFGGQLDPIADDQTIFWELKRIALGIWNYIKNSGEYDADDLVLEWIGNLPGRRASRRMQGAKILTQHDLLDEKGMDEAVCFGGWPMDIHPSGGIRSEKQDCRQQFVHCYGIPLGCLYHQEFPNLFFAGRQAALSYAAFSSARVMNTCALMGEAAGTAAAMCAEREMTPEHLHRTQLPELREKLAVADVLLAGQVSMLKPDHVNATSNHESSSQPDGRELPLREPTYAVFPCVKGQQTSLRFSCKDQTLLSWQRVYESLPSRNATMEPDVQTIILPEGVHDVCFIAEEDGFMHLTFAANSNVSLCGGTPLPGVQAGYCTTIYRFFPCISMNWDAHYQADNAADGWIRPWKGVHAWVAGDGAGERLTYRWDTPQKIDRVLLMFDPDLSAELTSSRGRVWGESHNYVCREGMPSSLVRDYRLVAKVDGREVCLCEVNGNHQRRKEHHFDPVYASELTLEVKSTYGGYAVVYTMAPQFCI